MHLSYSVILAILATVNADQTATTRAFVRYKIVPDIISTPPNNQAYVRFASGAQVRLGNVLQLGQVQDAPKASFNPWADKSSYYTFMLVDPDAPEPTDPEARSWLHWLVTNIPGGEVSSGETWACWVCPTPPDAAQHRYVFLAFKQPGKVQFQTFNDDNRAPFNVTAFAGKYGFQQTPVA
ncbi:phosphatidylethanolamine-binding protein-like precursor, partial [Aphelenchoides avenae]